MNIVEIVDGVHVENQLQGGEEFPFAQDPKAIHTPGHTEG